MGNEIRPETIGGGQPVVTAELHLDNLADKTARDFLRRACAETKYGPVAVVNRAGRTIGRIVAPDPLAELVRVSEEMGLYEATADACVCVTHLTFVPCRKRDGCVISQDAADVARAAVYQREA